MATKPDKARYRLEDGRVCIDIYLHTAQQLFDSRDPAPFRDRDEDVADYIYSAATDIPFEKPLKLVLFLEHEPVPPLGPAVIPSAVRAYFAYEAERANQRLSQQRRFGRVALAAGLTVLVVFLTLAEIGKAYQTGHGGEIVREGLVITGWVAMWKPIEVLLYDWWPLVEQRRHISRLVASEIEVRALSDRPVSGDRAVQTGSAGS